MKVADSSDWREFTVGSSHGKGGNPYYVDLPEENMRVIPYPTNDMLAWYADTFDVEVIGKTLKVTRIDMDDMWGMNLKLYIASGRSTQTFPPSSSPAASTSSSPTTAPSSFPTASTSSSPTVSPSSPPVEDCLEQPESDFFFMWKGEGATKQCSWLNTTSKGKREAACEMENNSDEGMPPASVMCRESCGLCPRGPSTLPSLSPSSSMAPSFQGDCAQSGSSRFLFLIKKNTGKEVWKTCNDLASWAKKKRKNACRKDYDNGSEAKFICRATCVTCPSECELNVEELEDINAALQKRLDELEASMKE